jgi:hypothetical protein
MMLRVYSVGASGLRVNIAPYIFRSGNQFVRFPGREGYPLSTHQPSSGKAVRVLVYLNRITNTIGSVAGAEVPDNDTLLPPDPTIPDNCTASALVRLDGDQSVVDDGTDIEDVRDWLYGVELVSQVKSTMVDMLAWMEHDLDEIITKHVVLG